MYNKEASRFENHPYCVYSMLICWEMGEKGRYCTRYFVVGKTSLAAPERVNNIIKFAQMLARLTCTLHGMCLILAELVCT